MRTSHYGCGIIIVITIIISVIISAFESITSNILNVVVFIIGLLFVFSLPTLLDTIANRKKQEKSKEVLIKITSCLDKRLLSKETIKALKNKMYLTIEKMVDINAKINKLAGYKDLLRKNSVDNDTSDIIKKQEHTISYLCDYFDKYASIYLDMFLQIEVELFNNMNIKEVNVMDYIDSLKYDMDNATDFIKKFSAYSKSEHNNTNKSSDRINETIKSIMTSLVSFHSNKVLSELSPVEDSYNVITNDEYNSVILTANDLDNQYERFIQEINLSYKQ